MTKDEALRLALDELCRVYHEDEADSNTLEVIVIIKQASEQPEQEPVPITITGKLGNIYSFMGDYNLKKGDKVYTSPPKREWQGLTDEEMNECWGDPLTPLGMKHARMIEAKLKEKNT
jgi:hypothetical protein